MAFDEGQRVFQIKWRDGRIPFIRAGTVVRIKKSKKVRVEKPPIAPQHEAMKDFSGTIGGALDREAKYWINQASDNPFKSRALGQRVVAPFACFRVLAHLFRLRKRLRSHGISC